MLGRSHVEPPLPGYMYLLVFVYVSFSRMHDDGSGASLVGLCKFCHSDGSLMQQLFHILKVMELYFRFIVLSLQVVATTSKPCCRMI